MHVKRVWVCAGHARASSSTDPNDPPTGCPHVHTQLVTSSDPVVGRASVETFRGATFTAGVVVDSASLVASCCRFEGGLEGGVVVRAGSKAELVDCSFALTACGKACGAFSHGTTVVLRGCKVEGCPATGSRGPRGEPRDPLAAFSGGALTLDTCTVDVVGVDAAVASTGPGKGAGDLAPFKLFF